jgi:hypothetical protein
VSFWWKDKRQNEGIVKSDEEAKKKEKSRFE